ISRPGDRVRADAVPGIATENAELVAVSNPDGIVIGIYLAANSTPGGIGVDARLPEEDHRPALVAHQPRVVGVLRVEGLQLSNHIVHAPEVLGLEVDGRSEIGLLRNLEQMPEVAVSPIAVAVPG